MLTKILDCQGENIRQDLPPVLPLRIGICSPPSEGKGYISRR